MFVGVIGMISTLLALVVIFAHGRDRRSLKYRILNGIFVSNLMFSISNSCGLNLIESGCSVTPKNSGTTLTVGWAIFMGSKYTIVAYEIFILAASISALQTGIVNWKPWPERIAHILCVVFGLLTFFTYAILTYDNFGTIADTPTSINLFLEHESAADIIINVSMTYWRTWLAPLGVVVVLWLYFRFMLYRMMNNWKFVAAKELQVLENEFPDDGCKFNDIVRDRKIKLLVLQRDAYLEIAKPLEIYVALFIFFSIPAIIMATDWCAVNNQNFTDTVNCNTVAELVLAVRSIATVLVFFITEPERQLEIFQPKILWNKCIQRISNVRDSLNADPTRERTGRRTTFSSNLTQVSEYDPTNGYGNNQENDEKADGSALIPYVLMADTQ